MPLRSLRPTKVLRPAQPLQTALNQFYPRRLSERDKQSKGKKKGKETRRPEDQSTWPRGRLYRSRGLGEVSSLETLSDRHKGNSEV